LSYSVHKEIENKHRKRSSTVTKNSRGDNCLHTNRDHSQLVNDADDGDSFHVDETLWLCLYVSSLNQLRLVSFSVLLLWIAFPTVAAIHANNCSVNIVIHLRIYTSTHNGYLE